MIATSGGFDTERLQCLDPQEPPSRNNQGITEACRLIGHAARDTHANTYLDNQSDGKRRLTRGLPGLVINSAEWLLPLICVYLVSASIAYAMDAAVCEMTNTTAMEGTARTTSITLPPDPRDDPLRVNLQSLTHDGLPRGLGPGGFPQTASVR